MLRASLMLWCCLLLAACHSGGKPQVWLYQCESGGVAQVTYEQDKAVLQYQGETHTLEQAISASGARYRNAALEWWSKGEEATLFADDHGNAGDIIDRCKHNP
ncbi:MliC family protein [Methylobacillus pratensis]